MQAKLTPLDYPRTPLAVAAGELVDKLTRAGHEAYFAGGCVRDALLGRPEKDIDVATAATPEQVQNILPRVSDLQGKSFGVLRVLDHDRVFEVATFRKDGSYKDGRRPDSVTFTNASEDAQRRDFTINGLFYDPLKSHVIDYVGGRKDLAARLVRCIGRAEDRFSEDHLRLFRAIRFASELDFEIEQETWKALCALSEQARSLAPERVRDEIIKSIAGSHPLKAFDLLDRCGLFRVWIPEIEKMKGVEQPPQFHPEGDVFTHVRMMIGQLKNPDPILALSVLLHDIAKPDTYTVDKNGRIRFNGHESVGAAKAENILQRLRFSNDTIEAVKACVVNHMAFKDAPQMRLSTLKRFLARPWFDIELELHRIDCLSSHALLDIYKFLCEQREKFSKEEIKPKPLVNGNDLLKLGVRPGKELGRLLTQLMDEQLEGKFTTREDGLARAAVLAKR